MSQSAPSIDAVSDAVWPLTIYYDASCPLCEAEMQNLRLRDGHGRLQLVDASAAGFVSPLPGVPVSALMQQIHARRADGQVLRGVDVFVLAYQAADLPTVVRALRWPWLRPVLDALYPVLARHRQRLPRWLPRLVFEGAARRAALRASRQHCRTQGQCRIEAGKS